MIYAMIAVRTPLLALVGNPNTGKTTLFNALAGMNQRVGNYPGVTVETKKGKLHFQSQDFEIIDLPGTYSLAARSPDEMLAVDVILGHQNKSDRPDAVIVIVDASNLDRNLYLATQVLDLGLPVILVLNMIDVATGQGLTIDTEKLSANLGIPVVPIQANKGVGLDQLKAMIAHTLATDWASRERKRPEFPAAFESESRRLSERLNGDVPEVLVRRLLLDVGGYIETHLIRGHGPELAAELQAARQRLSQAGCPVPAIEARTRYAWIRLATKECVQRPAQRPFSWTDHIDAVLTHKIFGTVIFMATMLLIFLMLFLAAPPIMKWINDGIDGVAKMISDSMTPGPLRSLIVGGIFKGVGSILVFLPQIMMLFAVIAVLEDCGYMARAAFLMDKLMSKAGLSGKSFIPLLSSLACAVPGIMSARVIDQRRDRLATIVVAPLMSCSARLPVYMLLIGAFLGPHFWVQGLTLFGLYCLGLIVAPVVAFLLKRTLLRGETPVFVMEMPLYKVPSARLVLRRTFDAGWMFLRRAGTLILATMVVIWALLYFPANDANGQSFEEQIAALEAKDSKDLDKAAREKIKDDVNAVRSAWKQESVLGQIGKFMEPVFRPLGWDWKIGMAAMASFPAREVMVGTLGVIYGEGEVESDDIAKSGFRGDTDLSKRLQQEHVFTVPVAMSVLVFFALCCQCASTLVVIRRETNSWTWPAFTFVYMTVLAYVGAFIVFQVGRLF